MIFSSPPSTSARPGRFALALCLSALLAGCSPLGAFDTFVAKDEESVGVARNLAFANHARGRLDVYAPAAPAAGPKPIIIFFYGGSWNSGDKDDYAFAGRALAAEGFLTFVPDYRLLPDIAYPAFLEDCAQAVKWVRANAARYGGDPDRIVLVGHSAGAYNAAMLSLDPQWLGKDRQAVQGFAALAGPYSFLPLDTKVTIETFGSVPDLQSTQPVNFASADDPPALLLAGGRDNLVFASNSIALATRLSEEGAQVESRVYENLGHVGIMSAFARPFRAKAPVLDDVAGFARRVTSPDAVRRPAMAVSRLKPLPADPR